MYARAAQAGTMWALSMVWASLLRKIFSGLLVVGPQRLFAWRLLRLPLPPVPLWGTRGLLPLSVYARTAQAGTMRARNMVWARLLCNSSSGLFVVSPQRLFARRLLRPPLPPLCPLWGTCG